MKTSNTLPIKGHRGFSLIEVIMTVLTIGVLASVLIPNLLVSRQRAFDTQTQACLKELGTQHLIRFTEDFQYMSIPVSEYPPACSGLTVNEVAMTASYYEYTAQHPQSSRVYTISTDSGVEEL